MDRRDRTVVGGLVLALAVIVAAIAVPSVLPVGGSATGSPSPSPSPEPAVRYREGILGRPGVINPLAARTAADRAVVGLVYSGLLRLGPGDTLRPDLAAWWRPEDDGASWLVRIADDAAWQDGEPVTAADVAFTVAALADPAIGSPNAASWAQVDVEEVDERTVRFRLESPLGGFPWLLTQPLAPAHQLAGIPLDTLADDPAADPPIGSGPFRIASLDASGVTLEPVQPVRAGGNGDVATAEGSPSALTPRPLLPGIDLTYWNDPDALAAAAARGVVDGAGGLLGKAATTAGGADGWRLLRYPGTNLTTVVLDLRPDHKELRDPRVRTALMTAIDRDRIVGQVLDGHGTPADSPIPPSSSLFDPTVSPPVEHDPKAAARLLKEAGWKRLDSGRWVAPGASRPYAIELLTPPASLAPGLAETARLVAEDWSSLGIATIVTEVPFAKLVERLHAGDFTAATVEVAVGHDPDLYPLLASSQIVSDGLNVSGVQDRKLDALLVRAREAVGDEARKAAYKELGAYLATTRYLPTLYFADEPFAAGGALQGPSPRPVAGPGDRYWDVLTWRLAPDR